MDAHNVPYVRAAGAPRVVSTATNWTVGAFPALLLKPRLILETGFAAASHQRVQPYLNTILSEEVLLIPISP